MAKQSSLTDIVSDYQKKLGKYKESLVALQNQTTEAVIQTGDAKYISAYEGLITHLYEEAKEGRLSERVVNLTTVLDEKKSLPTKRTRGPGYIPPREGIQYLMDFDKSQGNPIISEQGYRLRISTAVKNKEVKAKMKNNRIRLIKRKDLKKLTGSTLVSGKRKTSHKRIVGGFKEYKLGNIVNYMNKHDLDISDALSRLGITGRKARGFTLAFERHYEYR
jgi:hypothetical protein